MARSALSQAKRAPSGVEAKPRPAAGERYIPPPDWERIGTAELGFTNGALLRFPSLFAAGDLALLREPAVAVVGARDASPEGLRRAHQIARDLSKVGIVVMSGLAAGIDAAAHRSAIASGGRTIAVTAMPLDRTYPAEHAGVQMEIYRHHLLLTPFASGQRIFPKDFPDRNRVMARLARATIVVEATDSSGTLHQVVESIAAQRPVFIPKSVVANPAITWPQRFLEGPLVFTLESMDEVVDRVVG